MLIHAKLHILHLVLILVLVVNNSVKSANPLDSKVIIAGICKDSGCAVENTICNIEKLGANFKEYAVIIYENNSSDATPQLYSEWASKNSHVTFISETLPDNQLNVTRTENIARARNKVLACARAATYSDFDYFIFADLDFTCPWPIQEILETIAAPYDWDCVSANGILSAGSYWDRYAYRGTNYPLGPELIDNEFWDGLLVRADEWFTLTSSEWVPVFSAFGGLAIYKMKSILPFTYSGVVTEDLVQYYKCILSTIPHDNRQLQKYLSMNNIKHEELCKEIPIICRENTMQSNCIVCCEHVTLHSSMALNGYGKFYINPRLNLKYIRD